MSTSIIVALITAVVGPSLTLILTNHFGRKKDMNNIDKKLDTVLEGIEDLNKKVSRINEGFDVLAYASESVFESLHNKQYINGETEKPREDLKHWMMKNGSLSRNN